MSPCSITIGNSTLWLGDCREILPELAPHDAMITDPVWPNCPAGLIPGSENPQQLWNEAMNSAPRLTRAAIVMRSDSDPRFLQNIPMKFFKCQFLSYIVPGYIGRKLGGDEILYGFGEPIVSAPGRRVIPTWGPKVQSSGSKEIGHPCPRPLKHFTWVVNWWSDEGESVLDPFMGSGTTGVACAQMDRKFTGIEIERKYFDIACERIHRACAQGRLFESTARIPVQQQLEEIK